MVWKVFFVITTILVFLINLFGYNSDYSGISGLQYSVGLLIQFCIIFILGILYSLGWKQQLFSKKSTNIFMAIFIISMILFPIASALQAYPVIYTQVQNAVAAIIGSVIGSLIVAIIVNLFLIPFYIGLYKYKKFLDTLTVVNKPYWKMLALYIATALTGNVVSALTKYSHFSQYNLIDFYIIISCVYEIILIIGFAWNIRIFNKLFWQITAIPYVILTLVTPFFMSDAFNQDFHFKELLLNNPIAILFTIMLSIVFFFVIYQYAYKEKI